jgi:hypothetical protein
MRAVGAGLAPEHWCVTNLDQSRYGASAHRHNDYGVSNNQNDLAPLPVQRSALTERADFICLQYPTQCHSLTYVYLLLHITNVLFWPSGLRRPTQVRFSSEAWVRIPQRAYIYTYVYTYIHMQRLGAVEARWAHNPKVRGSKPRAAIYTLYIMHMRMPVRVYIHTYMYMYIYKPM